MAVAAAAAGCSQEPPPTPNLIIVTLDALRADSLGYAGHPLIKTPHMDGVAEDGVVFTQAISSFVGTTASMPSLMTGRLPNFVDVTKYNRSTWQGFSDLNDPDETAGLTRNVVTLAEILRDRGWVTAGFNTNPHTSRRAGFAQGFDHFDGCGDYLTPLRNRRTHRLDATYPPADVVLPRAASFITDNQDQPFFVWIHLMEPHSPYRPPPPFNRLDNRSYSELDDLAINEHYYHLLRLQKRETPLDNFFKEHPSAFDHLMALYDGEIRFADHELGKLFDRLRELGLWQHTMVVITADHGEEFFDHDFVCHHTHHPLYDELLHIPLALHLPDRFDRGARVVEQQVRSIDIAPTVLDYFGLAAENRDMDGISLRDLITGQCTTEPSAFVSSVPFHTVRTSRWKYHLIKGNRRNPPGEELYDLMADPRETSNIVSRRLDVLECLRSEHDRFVAHLRSRGGGAGASIETPEPPDLDRETREQLRDLGYLD